MSLFDFKLHDLKDIQLYDSIPWFHLSDAHYWMEIGDVKLFEGTDDHTATTSDEQNRFVDYYLARLVEDLQYILEDVSEPVPDDLFQRVRTIDALKSYCNDVCKYRDIIYDRIHEEHDGEEVDKIYDRYDQLTEWLGNRKLPTMHLAYGLGIFFIRNNDTMTILWDATQLSDEGKPVWTAESGQYEMPYQQFVSEVQSFRDRVFFAMGGHIADVNKMDIMVSEEYKQGRILENKERLERFNEYMLSLNTDKQITDWQCIREVITEVYK